MAEKNFEDKETKAALSRELVIEALEQVFDPELLIDVWTLGLIYDINIDGSVVQINMTFTSLGCPAGAELVGEVKEKVGSIPDVTDVVVNLVFSPRWEPSEDLKALLGLN